MSRIRSRIGAPAALTVVVLVAVGGTVAVASAGGDDRQDESFYEDPSVKMVPDRVPVADSTGAVVGHIPKDKFLHAGIDSGDMDPVRAFHERSMEVLSDQGEVVGVVAGEYGFVPAADVDDFMAKIDSGELPTTPTLPPGVERPPTTVLAPAG